MIPQYNSPRASLTVYLYSMLKVLHSPLGINKNDIIVSLRELEKLKQRISSSNLTDKNPSLSIAEYISGIPVIYYPFGLKAAAIRFKNSFQENSKQHAMTENILESCHNGIVSWEKPSDIQPILLEGQDDFIKTKERWEIVKEYFDINEIKYKEVFSVKGNILSKLVNLIYILDYSSIYHSVLTKTDPSPVKSIDFIKSKL